MAELPRVRLRVQRQEKQDEIHGDPERQGVLFSGQVFPRKHQRRQGVHHRRRFALVLYIFIRVVLKWFLFVQTIVTPANFFSPKRILRAF